tara:strand:- start:629 stop:895 length:267 start_codon:yes stop_codon:yes gene_type:complete
MTDEEREDLDDHAFDEAFSNAMEELNGDQCHYSGLPSPAAYERATMLSEAAPGLKQIAKEYNLKLSCLSDFRIARILWAKSLRQVDYE